jgi:hypothetical protein
VVRQLADYLFATPDQTQMHIAGMLFGAGDAPRPPHWSRPA